MPFTQENQTQSQQEKSAITIYEPRYIEGAFFTKGSINGSLADGHSVIVPKNIGMPSLQGNSNNISIAPLDAPKRSMLSKIKIIPMGFVAIGNGGLYFFVAAAGAGNIKNLLHLEGNAAMIAMYSLGAGASVCYGMFVYKTLENLTLIPRSCISWPLAALGPFAASSFLTAGMEGAKLLSVPVQGAVPIGISLFALRMVNMLDGAVKFPGRSKEVTLALYNALRERNLLELFRLAVTLYASAGFTLSTTDSIFAAVHHLATLLGANESTILSACCYTASGLGAIGGFPMVFYWTHRGTKQITFGGKPDATGVNRDPTDIHTFLAVLATIPVILGILGSATSASGQAFTKLGVPAVAIRVSSSILYSVCGGVPGLATLSRGFFSIIPTVSKIILCKGEKSQIEEEHVDEQTLPLFSSQRAETTVTEVISQRTKSKSIVGCCGFFSKKKVRNSHNSEGYGSISSMPTDTINPEMDKSRNNYRCIVM